jgi:hypothetical protein
MKRLMVGDDQTSDDYGPISARMEERLVIEWLALCCRRGKFYEENAPNIEGVGRMRGTLLL